MIYLASPYSNDPEGNYHAMVEVGKRLLQRVPYPVFFSPVVHFHPMGENTSYEPMVELCLAILQKASSLVVVALPEWQRSSGVRREVEFWKRVCRPSQGRTALESYLSTPVLLDPISLRSIQEITLSDFS